MVPLNKPFLLLDSGANPEMTADQLLTLAKMGEVYASEVMGIKSPRIGLLNNGTESGKGTEVCREAYVMLRDSMPGFIGNIEGRDLTRGICDVVVTDGFTGNIALKSIEGTAEFAFSTIRSTLGASLAWQDSRRVGDARSSRPEAAVQSECVRRRSFYRHFKAGDQGARRGKRSGDRKDHIAGAGICRCYRNNEKQGL